MKIIVPISSSPTHNWKFQKNSKKIKKIQLWLPSNPNYVGEGQERGKMKIIVLIRSYPTHNWKFQKNSNKKRKSNKYPYGFISSQNRLENAKKERKEKLSFRFVLARRVIENFKKIEKTIQKIKKDHYGFFSIQNT